MLGSSILTTAWFIILRIYLQNSSEYATEPVAFHKSNWDSMTENITGNWSQYCKETIITPNHTLSSNQFHFFNFRK
jgi:hypothetical protein